MFDAQKIYRDLLESGFTREQAEAILIVKLRFEEAAGQGALFDAASARERLEEGGLTEKQAQGIVSVLQDIYWAARAN